MLTLIIGKAKTGKTTKLMEYVRSSTAMGMSQRILIVPEQLSHRMERLLAMNDCDELLFVSEVLSFTRLSSRLESLYGGGAITALDETGRLITARLAMNSIQSQLKACAASAGRPDFLTEILCLIDELKTSHITVGDLNEMAGKTAGMLSVKLKDLALILSAYNAAVAQGSADPRDRLYKLKKKLEDYPYAEQRDFFLDGFSDFTAQEYEIIDVLMKKCANMTITVLCDSLENPNSIFSAGAETISRLLKLAARNGVKAEIVTTDYRRPGTEVFSWLGENLFQPIPETREEPCEQVIMISSTDRIDECRKCAAYLRSMAMNGIRFRDMFIAAGNTDAYMGLMKEACSDLEIPLYSSHKHQLLSYPCVSFLLLAMEAVMDGMKADAMLAYLKTGYTGLAADDVDNIENYVVTWAIRGKKWSDEWKQHPDGYDGHPDSHTEAYLLKLNKAREFVLHPLLHFAEKLKKAATVREQAEALYYFIEETQLYEQINLLTQREIEAGDFNEAQELSQVWSTLMQAMQQLVAVMGSLYEKPENFVKLVKLSLQQYEIGTIPDVLDSVTFGGIADVRGNEPKVLCILGVNEGAVPETISVKGFLSDHERIMLRTEYNMAIGSDSEQQLERSFLQIYSAVAAPTERLYISWHLSEGGAAVLPSYLIDRIQHMLPHCLKEVDETAGFTADRAVRTYLIASEGGEDPMLPEIIRLSTTDVPVIDEKIEEAIEHAKLRDLLVLPEDSLRLFGNPVQLSASKLDGIRKCPLEFFFHYGLKAQKREKAAFNAAEFGTFVHRMLELTVPELVRTKENPMSLQQLGTLLKKHMSAYKDERLENNSLSSRDSYLFDRNYRETMFILTDVADELQKTDFIPSAFELKFGGKDRPALLIHGENGTGAVVGTVDRADIWHTEQHDYFRIIDYKSGTEKFDFTEVYGGVGLQMLLYLFQLEATGITQYGQKPLPAGVLYHPAKYEIQSTEGPDPDCRKHVARTGLVLADETVIEAMEHGGTSNFLPVKRDKSGPGNYAVTQEQLQLLKHFVRKRLSQSVDRIVSGRFTPEPFYMGETHNPCQYCSYHDICQKDRDFAKSWYRTKIKAEEFWQKIGDEIHG